MCTSTSQRRLPEPPLRSSGAEVFSSRAAACRVSPRGAHAPVRPRPVGDGRRGGRRTSRRLRAPQGPVPRARSGTNPTSRGTVLLHRGGARPIPESLSTIDVPTLVLWGGRDQFFPVEQVFLPALNLCFGLEMATRSPAPYDRPGGVRDRRHRPSSCEGVLPDPCGVLGFAAAHLRPTYFVRPSSCEGVLPDPCGVPGSAAARPSLSFHRASHSALQHRCAFSSS